MTALRKMNEEECRAFRASSVSEYAEDLMKERDIPREQALKDAEKEFDGDFPDGPATEGGFAMNVADAAGNRVGWILFKYYAGGEGGGKRVFLADLLIFEAERRKGFASAAIREMNAMAKRDGCASSGLFVWDHNPGGMRLYEKCGYRPAGRGEGGTYMVKEL